MRKAKPIRATPLPLRSAHQKPAFRVNLFQIKALELHPYYSICPKGYLHSSNCSDLELISRIPAAKLFRRALPGRARTTPSTAFLNAPAGT